MKAPLLALIGAATAVGVGAYALGLRLPGGGGGGLTSAERAELADLLHRLKQGGLSARESIEVMGRIADLRALQAGQ